MATTAKGTPYVVSTDLVANYPTVSSDLADHIDDNLAYNAVSINAQTGTTYTFALADASEGKLVTASNAASSTYTVPPQSSVTWADGAVLRILNQGAGVVTIAAGSGVTINGTPLTLAQYKGAAIQRTASNTWTFIPFSGGVGNAVISDTPTGSYTGYNYWSYTASGTLNVTTAGFADVLVIGAAGGGGCIGGGGGAGGHLEITNAYLPAGALTVTVGAGGAGATAINNVFPGGGNGNTSRLGSYYSTGGGAGGGAYGGAGAQATGFIGGSGGGAGGGGGYAGVSGNGGAGTTGLGNNGGNNSTGASSYGCGGGGGASAVGANGTSSAGGNGGAGSANSYTGASVTRAGGGGGGSQGGTAGTGGTGGGGNGSNGAATGGAGTANTGGGGGGGGYAGGGAPGLGAGGAGGSGIVIVRVAV
jgi:hypothetical protein